MKEIKQEEEEIEQQNQQQQQLEEHNQTNEIETEHIPRKPLDPIYDSCDSNPDFAIICSFILQFGDKIEIQFSIEQLKSGIEDQTKFDDDLIEIHVKLLKKIRRYFVRDLWEKALVKFIAEYSYEDACELDELGYLKTRTSIKLELLRRLLDAQFECNQKFKAALNLCDADELRILPLGRDNKGNSYWKQMDTYGNFRIYQEQPLDYKSWRTVCTKPEELNYLIEDLDKNLENKIKGEPMNEPYNPYPEIYPELFIKEEPKIEEDKNDQEDTQAIKTRKGGRLKKRGRGRTKKCDSLSILDENDEEEEQKHEDNFKSNGNIELSNNNHPFNNNNINFKKEENFGDPQGDFSRQNENINTNGISNKNDLNNSLESQVRYTIDNLITKVLSSFDYIMRPLSRQSNNGQNDTSQETASSIKFEEPKPAPKKKQASKKAKVKTEEPIPRRASSRIQQLQAKKIAEQEEEIKKMIESNNNKKSTFVPQNDDDSRSRTSTSRTAKKRSESPSDSDNKPRNGKKRKKGRGSGRRGKGKKKLSWDKDDSDLSSNSSQNESVEENDDLDETFQFDLTNKEEDDEFACEEEDTNNEPVIIKRARTARRSLAAPGDEDAANETLNSTSTFEEDKPCSRCDKSNDPEWILLCDMCDDGYHTSCCMPPLMIVPDGDWFCPPCEHKTLLIKLKEFYASIIEMLEARERERIKKEKKPKNVYVPRKTIDVEPKIEEAPQDVVTYPASNKFEGDELEDEEDDFTDMEVDDGATSDESFKASSATELEDEEEEDDLTETEEDEEDEMTERDSFDDSDATSIDEIVAVSKSKSSKKDKRTKKKHRRMRRREDRYDSDDDYDDYQPSRRQRRAAAQRVSYKESTDEEDELLNNIDERDDMDYHPQDQYDNVVQTIKEPESLDISSNQLMPTIIKAQNLDLQSTSPVHPPFYNENDFEP